MSSILKKQQVFDGYKAKLEQMVSDSDFHRYLPDADGKIMKYVDLAKYNTMDELLPYNDDYRIILTETKKNSGHWCCLVKYGNVIEWWDSYGVRPEGEMAFIPQAIKQMLGETRHELNRLFDTVPEDKSCIYNKKKVQELKDGINTCGKWCICRVQMAMFGYNLPNFLDFLKRQKEETGKPYDILVSEWILV
jgi:hypothetical protein